MNSPLNMLAIDIGNSRIKIARFHRPADSSGDWLSTGSGLPEPDEVLAIAPAAPSKEFDFAPLGDWLASQSFSVDAPVPVVVGSVCHPALEQLQAYWQHAGLQKIGPLRVLCNSDLPITNLTHQPEHVGIDRLAVAVAAHAIQLPGTSAMVVDFGTAITVDLINSEGAFEGGAILPGIGLAAASLAQGTDALPALSDRITKLLFGKSPPSVGKSTEGAIEAGLYWGTLGALRELIARHADSLTSAPQVLVTGSTSPEIARLLNSPHYTVRYIPHMVLAGLALTADDLLRSDSSQEPTS